MRRKSWTSAAAVAALLLTTAILTGPGSALAANAPSPWGASYFPNVELTTQDGKTVHFWDDLIKDKKVVINFIYTECGASCPLETAKLVQVQKTLGERMGKDIFFYSITLDPKRDTPAALKAYADKFHVGPGWLFLTGNKADIELVRKKLGLAAASFQNELTDHSTRLMIGNGATGQWISDSPMDDPRYIAAMAGDWLSSWQGHKKGESYDKVPPLENTTDKGQYLFKTRCAACHTVGKGDGVGPDLLGVTNARDHAWLARFVIAPDQVLASGDPIATALFAKYNKVKMPNLQLGEKDVDELIKFIATRTASNRTPETKEPELQIAADGSASAGGSGSAHQK